MNERMLRALCFDEPAKPKQPQVADSHPTSIREYLSGVRKKDITPSAITRRACELLNQSRTDVRNTLSRVTDSERRLLLKEKTRIQQRITDGLGYEPILCWAIQRVVDSNDLEAMKMLSALREAGTLPREVARWFNNYERDPESFITDSAERLLKPYAIMGDSPLKRVTDAATSIDKYLSPGEEQEEELNEVISETVSRANSLSDESRKRLDAFKEEAKRDADSFLRNLIDKIDEVIPDVAAQDAADDGAAVAQETIEGQDDQEGDGDEFANPDDMPKDGDDKLGDSADDEIFCDDGKDNITDSKPKKVYDSAKIHSDSLRAALKNKGMIKDSAAGDPVFSIEDRVLNIDEDSPEHGNVAEVIDISDVPGCESVMTVKYGNGIVKMAKPAQFKLAGEVTDSVDGAAPMPPIQIIKEPGETTIYPAQNVQLKIDNWTKEATVVDVDPILRTVTVHPQLEGEKQPEEIIVSEDVAVDYPTEPVPENPLDPTEERVMDAVKGIPTKMLEMFKKGQTIKINFTVKDVKYNQGLLAMGKGRLVVELDGDIPRKLYKRFAADIESICRKEGYDVEVKFPKTSPLSADNFAIVFKGNSVSDSVENPMEKTQHGDVVSYFGSQYYVDRANEKQVTLADPETGRLIVVDGKNLAEIYLVSKVDRDPNNDPDKTKKNQRRVGDSADGDEVRNIVHDWAAESSATLATEVTVEAHIEALGRLTDRLVEVDSAFNLDKDSLAVNYGDKAFAVDNSSSINVGGTLFLYQTTESGIDTLATQVGDVAMELYDTLRKDVKDSKDEDAFLTEEDVKEVFDSVGLKVADAADASMLTEEAKKEVLDKVQEKILERLKESGLEVGDSADGYEWKNQGAAALRMNMGIPVKDASGKSCKVTGVGRKGYKVTDEEGNETVHEYPFLNNTQIPTLEEALAKAESETETELTEEQKASGNYNKGHFVFGGRFDIAIENPRGSVRSGKDSNGKEWSNEMKYTYGYIDGTHGSGSDDVDAFIGPDLNSKDVFVIDQNKDDGTFDEHKVMLGFTNSEDARAGYLSAYDEGWESHIGNITKCTLDDLYKWLDTKEVRKFPFVDYIDISTEPKVKDTMDQNEDGDSRIHIGWSKDQLAEYLKRMNARAAKSGKYVSDSSLPKPAAATQAGTKNHYDIEHTKETFRQVWDSDAELDKVLRSASRALGRDADITRDDYKTMLEQPDEHKAEMNAISDAAFSMNALGLFSPDLYKQRFADECWVADSAESLEEPFGLQVPDEYKGKPVLVSTRPFSPDGNHPVVDSMTQFPYDSRHGIYMAALAE